MHWISPQSGCGPYSNEEESDVKIPNAAGYDESTLRDLEVGTNQNETKEIVAAISSSSETEASSIIKLNNGDVLYMKEINRLVLYYTNIKAYANKLLYPKSISVDMYDKK